MNDNQSPPFIKRAHLAAFIFFTVFLVLLYQMGRLLASLSSALLWAAVLALALHPAYRRIRTLLRGRQGPASAVMTVVTLLLVVGPAMALLASLAAQAIDLYQWTVEGIKSGAAADLWNKLADYASQKVLTLPLFSGLDLRSMIIKGVGQLSSGLAEQAGAVLRNTALLAVNLAVMLIALFFFFRNGERYYEAVMELVPFTQAQKQALARKVLDTFTAVLNGVFLIALLQGLMTGLGFALFGVPLAVFWGFLAALLALLPIGGAALVWVPGSLFLFLTGSALRGALLAVWGVVLVTLPDNVLKPLIIGRKAKLPTFLLFIGILGGLQVYGFLGILFGPLLVTLLTAFVRIYREEYLGRQS